MCIYGTCTLWEFSSESDFEGLSYSVHSLQGQLIMTGLVNSNPVSIDISSLSTGVYFVYLYSNLNEAKLIKIIKN